MTFDEIEEHRDRVAGLEYEDWREARVDGDALEAAGSAGMASRPEGVSIDDAYEPDDPKSEGFHARYADVWDMREGK